MGHIYRGFLIRIAVAVSALALLSGCMTLPAKDTTDYSATPPPAMPSSGPGNGAIYHESNARPLFEDLKARHVGDVLTIVLTESTSANKSASTNTSKEATVEAETPTVFGVTKGRDFLNNEIGSTQEFSGAGDSSQSNSLSGTVTVTVAKVLPNGNLFVRGRKRVFINQGEEYVMISGIVRPQDIDTDNTVQSTRVADARITYAGKGALAESNTMGWLARFFNSPLWPF